MESLLVISHAFDRPVGLRGGCLPEGGVVWCIVIALVGWRPLSLLLQLMLCGRCGCWQLVGVHGGRHMGGGRGLPQSLEKSPNS